MTMFHTRGWGDEDSRLVNGVDFKPAQLPARGELLPGRPRGCPGCPRPRGWLRPDSRALGRRRISGARSGCVLLSSTPKSCGNGKRRVCRSRPSVLSVVPAPIASWETQPGEFPWAEGSPSLLPGNAPGGGRMCGRREGVLGVLSAQCSRCFPRKESTSAAERSCTPCSPVPFNLFLLFFFSPSFPFPPTENLRGRLRRAGGCLGIHLAECEGKLPVCLLPAELTARQGPANPHPGGHRLAERGRSAAAACPPRPRMRGGGQPRGRRGDRTFSYEHGGGCRGALGLPARSAASPHRAGVGFFAFGSGTGISRPRGVCGRRWASRRLRGAGGVPPLITRSPLKMVSDMR